MVCRVSRGKRKGGRRKRHMSRMCSGHTVARRGDERKIEPLYSGILRSRWCARDYLREKAAATNRAHRDVNKPRATAPVTLHLKQPISFFFSSFFIPPVFRLTKCFPCENYDLLQMYTPALISTRIPRSFDLSPFFSSFLIKKNKRFSVDLCLITQKCHPVSD